jgi:signal transduction histidine kinase/ligand-binding sensor domain-containing protein
MGTPDTVMSRRRLARAGALLLALCLPAAALGIDPEVALADLQRSHWSRLQGAPANPELAMTTSDGMLWLFGPSGVHRFDGVRFHPFVPFGGEPLAAGNVTATLPDADGGLWLGQSNGELVHVHGRTATHYPPMPGIHTGTVRELAIDSDGRLWVVTKAGLSMLAEGQWKLFGAADGIAGSQVDGMALGTDGRAWVLTDTGLFVGEAGNARFVLVESIAALSHMGGVLLSPGGEVWKWNVLGEANLCRLVPQDARGCWTVIGLINPRFDRHGALWWGTANGISRLVDTGELGDDPGDLARQAQFVDVHAEALAFGIDGSIWAAEATGVTRLRETPLQHLRTPSGALAPANDGSVWLGSFSRGLMQIGVPPPGTPLFVGYDETLWTDAAVAASADLAEMMKFQALEESPAAGMPVVIARYLASDAKTLVRLDPMPDGGVRVGTLSPARLFEHDGRTAHEIALPALDRGSLLRGAQRDSRGDLWVATALNGVPFFRLRDGEWQPYGGVTSVQSQAINGFALGDDDIWIAIGKDAVARIRDGAWTRFGPEQGVALGQAIQPLLRDGQVWVAGSQGFQGLAGDRFVSLVGSDGDRFIGTSGALQLENGDLWLHGAAGISRIEPHEWRRALRDPAYRVAYRRFDHFDGNMAGAMQGAPVPSLVRASDGMLWAATDGQLLRLDPRAVRPALPAPAVQLLSFSVDDVPTALDAGIALPVGASRIGFTFAAPPTDHPERIRFRYRLQAFGEWIEAGDRREVLYEALPPGNHLFEIVASDRDGRWGETPTRFAFVLPPRFHQTTTFQLLIALAVGALLAALYAIRMRQIAERTRRETTARLHERMRISRDLHDTLLQSVQALHMHVQSIAARVPDDDPLRQRVDLVLERAHDTIREGRDRISTLRDPLAGTMDLAECLQRIAQRLARDADVLCDVQFDAPRALQPMVYDELLQIGREALTNALQHAHATRVTLRVTYADEGVTITVADDGAGLPSDVLQHGGRDGHFGMRGMRERAALIGAELQVRNVDATGAEVAIRVPAQRAYLRPVRGPSWLATLRQRRFAAWPGRAQTD